VPPQATADHYRQQQRLTVVAIVNVRRLWAEMNADFDTAWRPIRPRMVALLSATQNAAASSSDAYVSAVLAETGQPDEPLAGVAARRFVGVAADGRSLGGLLDGALVAARTSSSTSSADALAHGGRWLEMATQTLVADTSRSATSVAIAVRPDIGGYVRMLNTPSCARCVVLAGRFYRWNEGFRRHPRCDCRHIPASENIASDFTTDPAAYFDQLSRVDQNATFTAAGAQAVRDGADLNQVVNARRGIYTTVDGSRATTVGTSSRTAAGRAAALRRDGGARLMPEEIYANASSREQAIELLRRYGFLT
jgi:hypothetical protein